jgi:hypothetical protein
MIQMFIQSVGCRVEPSKRRNAIDARWLDGRGARSLNDAWFLDNALAKSGFLSVSASPGIDEMLDRVNQEARQIITQKLTQVLLNNSPLVRSLVPSFETRLQGTREVMVRDNPPALALRTGDSSITLLTQNRLNSTRNLRELRLHLAELARLTKNLGTTLQDVSYGPHFARNWLSSNPDVKGVSPRISHNSFERTVISMVKQISGSYLANVQVVFDNPPESHEYDLIIPVSTYLRFDIEVMDYSSVQREISRRGSSENLKSVILLRTKDKTLRLGPDVQLVVILRGFRKEVFAQIFELARSRRIVLLNDTALRGKLWLLMEYGLMSLFQEVRPNFWPLMEKYGSKMFEIDSSLERSQAN